MRRVRVLQSYPSEEPVLNDRGQQEHPPRTATRQRREPERRPGAGATLPFGRWTSSKARRAEDGCACAGLRGGLRVRTSRRLAGCLVTATRGSGFQFCPRSSFPSAPGARKAVPVCPARSPGGSAGALRGPLPARPPACSAPGCSHAAPRLAPSAPAPLPAPPCPHGGLAPSAPGLVPDTAWTETRTPFCVPQPLSGRLRWSASPRQRVSGRAALLVPCSAPRMAPSEPSHGGS